MTCTSFDIESVGVNRERKIEQLLVSGIREYPEVPQPPHTRPMYSSIHKGQVIFRFRSV